MTESKGKESLKNSKGGTMKRLVLLLIMCSSLWGLKDLKEWSDFILSNREEWCLRGWGSDATWCNPKIPTLPDDYKPTKEDKVLKVKVGNVEGEIVGVKGKGIFIRASSQKDFSYVDELRNPLELFLVNYPQYSVMVKIDNSKARSDGKKAGNLVDFYQIFEVKNNLRAFLLERGGLKWCSFSDNDFPCPFTKEYILDWIKKQGGQKFFDYACPQYHTADCECQNGIFCIND